PSQTPAALAQTHRQFRVLPSDHGFIVEVHLPQCRYSEQGHSPAAGGVADRNVPFIITQSVIDRQIGKSLAQSAENRCNLRVRTQHCQTLLDPTGSDLTISVHHLHELELWILRKEHR